MLSNKEFLAQFDKQAKAAQESAPRAGKLSLRIVLLAGLALGIAAHWAFTTMQHVRQVALIDGTIVPMDSSSLASIQPYIRPKKPTDTCDPMKTIDGTAVGSCAMLWPLDRGRLWQARASAETCGLVRQDQPFRMVVSETNGTKLDEFATEFSCQLVPLAMVPEYTPHGYHHQANILETQSGVDYRKTGAYMLYMLPSNEDGADRSRYFIFHTDGQHGTRLIWASDSSEIGWGTQAYSIYQNGQLQPLSSSDPRWGVAVKALTEANAEGCDSFMLSNGGGAHCFDSRSSWKIDFDNGTAQPTSF
ncbi:hypothetical protein [Pseudooceanicola nanhaiensis]|uniref:hypothetical protein n=1 Tax=Pseudooceanicola nanhaiensis TaxID=375761 RepID=UPI001CD68CAE|nr:hypothetical protein [Pseudooceanicola nanhaiensis]MCA0919353.1 hypothetical protein [Pseudooceanicola nanhaiensis]